MPHLTVLPNNEFGADSTPTYLFDYAEEYRTMHEAGRSWFRDARGLASAMVCTPNRQRRPVQYIDKIPVRQYEIAEKYSLP